MQVSYGNASEALHNVAAEIDDIKTEDMAELCYN